MRTRLGRTPFDLHAAQKFTNSNEANSLRLRIRNAKGNDPAELLVYDEVGKSWDGTGISAKDVAGFLADNRGKPINVKINSPGGLVYDGLSIYNNLLDHTGTVTCIIEGIAASIASIIAMAGDKVKAYESSSIMMHRALAVCVGNVADMADCMDWLKTIDGQLSSIYSAKTGKSAATMLAYMTGTVDGTVFTAQSAYDIRLVDEIIRNGGGKNASPRNPINDFDIKQIREGARRSQAAAKAARRVRELARV